MANKWRKRFKKAQKRIKLLEDTKMADHVDQAIASGKDYQITYTVRHLGNKQNQPPRPAKPPNEAIEAQ